MKLSFARRMWPVIAALGVTCCALLWPRLALGRGPVPIAATIGDSQTAPEWEPATDREPVDLNSIPDIDGPGWVPLTNGENLSGWSHRNGTASFAWEDGAVIGRTAVGSQNSYLCTAREFRDFELTFEIKLDTGLNSGVQIRSRSVAEFKGGRVHGPQIEIEALDSSNRGDSGYIYSEGTARGWVSVDRPLQDAFVNDQWNRFVIRAVGNRIQTWVNGRKVEDLCDDVELQNGFIALQIHEIGQGEGPYEARWRDIRVRPIADPAAVEP